MPAWGWISIVIGVLIVVAGIAWLVVTRRRTHPLPLVLRPAPVGLTYASLAARYDTVHGHGGLTPIRSTCTETTRPSSIFTRACDVSWTSVYPRPGTQTVISTGGRAPPGSTVPRTVPSPALSSKATGRGASAEAESVRTSERRPAFGWPYTRIVAGRSGRTHPSRVSARVLHASR